MPTSSWRLWICISAVFLHRHGVLVVLAGISRVEIHPADVQGRYVPV